MAANIIGMQEIASLASPRKRVVEQGFLEFFQDDGQTGSWPIPVHGRVRFEHPGISDGRIRANNMGVVFHP